MSSSPRTPAGGENQDITEVHQPRQTTCVKVRGRAPSRDVAVGRGPSFGTSGGSASSSTSSSTRRIGGVHHCIDARTRRTSNRGDSNFSFSCVVLRGRRCVAHGRTRSGKLVVRTRRRLARCNRIRSFAISWPPRPFDLRGDCQSAGNVLGENQGVVRSFRVIRRISFRGVRVLQASNSGPPSSTSPVAIGCASWLPRLARATAGKVGAASFTCCTSVAGARATPGGTGLLGPLLSRPNGRESINISFDHTTLLVCQKGPVKFLLCVIDARLALVSLCLKIVLLELVHLSHDGLKNGWTAHTIVRKPAYCILVDTNLSMSSFDSSGARCSYRLPHLNLTPQNAGEHQESVC